MVPQSVRTCRGTPAPRRAHHPRRARALTTPPSQTLNGRLRFRLAPNPPGQQLNTCSCLMQTSASTFSYFKYRPRGRGLGTRFSFRLSIRVPVMKCLHDTIVLTTVVPYDRCQVKSSLYINNRQPYGSLTCLDLT